MNATAFQPRQVTELTPVDDWDRLPWLIEEPRPIRRQLPRGLWFALIGLLTADAAASYWAGQASAQENWSVGEMDARSAAAPTGQMSTDDARKLADRISSAQRFAFQWRRPDAAY